MRTFTKSLLFIATLGTLSACGGGGSIERDGTSSTGTTTETGTEQSETTQYTVSVALQNSNAESDKNLTQGNSLTAIVQVLDQNGNPKADTLITFTLSNDELANFSNDTGTASTNENGEASIGLTVGSASGDGQLTATTANGEVGTTTFSSSGTTQESEQPASLNLFTDKVQLPSSGSDSAQLIALVKNAQSVLMEGQSVSFSAPADSGVEIQVDQAQTDASGRALATVSTRNNSENRTVQVTARVGELTQTLDVDISGTEVTINGAQSVILDDDVELTLRVQDSDGVAIANQTIVLEADAGRLAQNSVVTGSDGQASVVYTSTTPGEATITATSLNAQTLFTINVQEDNFTFSGIPDTDVELKQNQEITITWEKGGNPYAGGQVTFTASRGEIAAGQESAVTDAQGQATFTISSDNAGISAITATGIDDDNEQVSARAQIEFIATVPAAIEVDATPDIIGPDGQTSTINAIVRDDEGNLVKNAVISFTVDDTSTGSISPSQATTDSNGVASTVFTSGAVSSEDAVSVVARYVDNTSVFNSVSLTVGNRAFDISVGSGSVLQEADNSTYLKEFTVFVTDSAGRPIENEQLTVSATPVKRADNGEYRQGFWNWNDEDSIWFPVFTRYCFNEDQNADGILQPLEDDNGDNLLTPGIVGAVTFKDDDVTDANGQAIIELRYPKEYAIFTDVELSVFTRSTGSEASTFTRFTLPVLSTDITTESVTPPASPFGTGNTNCAVVN
ncbi:Ig-like domain-containing protein [Salinimonas lutimaris]|uniref:Ig-like domain-containing protein n=1 Tax=Salinimonas lutimaris TaxID=914153 RepID=UPI0010C02717|nr:Ig-like domain-containing protein [Salinimonas lutimaris]